MSIFNFKKKKAAVAMAQLEEIFTYVRSYPITRNPTVLSILHSISNTVSTLGLDLFQRTKVGSYRAYTHSTAWLMGHPNSEDSPTQFLYRLTYQYLSTGNAYILNINNARLHILDSTRMSVRRDSTAPSNKIYSYLGIQYTDNEIIHIYNPQYFDGTIGHSPIEYNREIVELLNALLLYVGTYFKNTAGERLVVTLDKDAAASLKDPDIKKEFDTWVREKISNPLRAGDMILGRPGMDFKSLKQTTNVESELSSLIARIENEIANLFGYPTYRLTGDYGNNLSTQQITYYQNCILPITEIFKEKFALLIPIRDQPFMYFDFDYENLLMPDVETKHKILREDVRGSLLTVNEGRAAIGRDMYTGGTEINIADALWVLRNCAPIFEEYRDLYIQSKTSDVKESSQNDPSNTN